MAVGHGVAGSSVAVTGLRLLGVVITTAKQKGRAALPGMRIAGLLSARAEEQRPRGRSGAGGASCVSTLVRSVIA
eukprot:COSAG01_NODE_4059_length_5388_cov_99.849121_1_plen_75_part_00